MVKIFLAILACVVSLNMNNQAYAREGQQVIMGNIYNNTPYVLYPRVSSSNGRDGYINRLAGELAPGASTAFEGFLEQPDLPSDLDRTIIIDARNNMYCTFRVNTTGGRSGNPSAVQSFIDTPINHVLKCEVTKNGGYAEVVISPL